MRNLVYVLTNGKVVGSLTEAQMSGMGYTAKCVPQEKQPLKMSEKRRQMLVQATAR